MLIQLIQTAGASALFRMLEYGAFLLLHTVLHVYYVVAIVLVTGISFVLKFVFYDRVIFGRENLPPA
jgi:hypothetical protein